MENQNLHERQERFSYSIPAIKSFSTEGVWMCRIWTEWYTRNISVIRKTSEVGKLAAQEGKLQPGNDSVAQQLAMELIDCGDNREQLNECAVKLYTKGTFVYKALNIALKNNDMSKVDTLGPLCFLINSYISQRKRLTEEQIVYRGMELTDEMINAYYEMINETIDWPAFTSTSKNRNVAEIFAGNTLCIITLSPGVLIHGADISDISHMPDEDEFLLSVSFELLVEKVEIDPDKKRHLIYLRTVFESE